MLQEMMPNEAAPIAFSTDAANGGGAQLILKQTNPELFRYRNRCEKYNHFLLLPGPTPDSGNGRTAGNIAQLVSQFCCGTSCTKRYLLYRHTEHFVCLFVL